MWGEGVGLLQQRVGKEGCLTPTSLSSCPQSQASVIYWTKPTWKPGTRGPGRSASGGSPSEVQSRGEEKERL